MSGKTVEVIRKREENADSGPKQPQKKKVIVLRKAKENEEFVKKGEIPVSIGIPEYYREMKQDK